jgi:single-stranded DNA-binding protein
VLARLARLFVSRTRGTDGMSRRPEERLKEGTAPMNTIAEFTIIGRVGDVRHVGSTLRVSVASSFSRRDNSGEWVERTRWNDVTVFGEATRGYVKRNIVKGDLIFTSGSMSQTKWEKDGETFYGVTLACERIERLCKGPNHGDDKDPEPQEGRRPPVDDSDIPF